MRRVWLSVFALALAAAPAAAATWPIKPSASSAARPPAKQPPTKQPAAKRKPVRCSATGVNVHPIVPLKAPAKVRAMHGKILEAAASCDYAALERLALAGRPKFDFSFGDDRKPGKYW